MKTISETYKTLNIDNSFINVKYAREYFPIPSKQDYKVGSINRYFLKKVNDYLIVESSYENWENVSGFLYEKIDMLWIISGPKNDVYSEGILQSKGAMELNTEFINQTNKLMPGIKSKLPNPLQFYKG